MIRFSNAYPLLIAYSVVGFPFIAAVSDAAGTDTTAISVVARAMVAILSVIVWGVSNRGVAFKGTKWFFDATMFFWLLYFLRLLFDTLFIGDELTQGPTYYWIWSIGVCLIPMLAMTRPAAAYHLSSAAKTAMIIGMIACGTVIATGNTIAVKSTGELVDLGRFGIRSLNPIFAGHLGLTTMIVGVSLLMQQGISIRWRGSGAAAILVGGVLMIISSSRGPLVSAVCVCIFAVLALPFSRRIKIVPILALSLFGIAIYANPLGEVFSTNALTRVESMFLGAEDLSVGSRQQSYSGALEQFIESPLLGSSIQERTTRFYPHNVVLEAFMATGVVGGGLMLFAFFYATRAAWRAMRYSIGGRWVGMLWIQYVVAAQFSGAIYTSSAMWVLAALVVSYDDAARSGALTERLPSGHASTRRRTDSSA